MNLNTVAIYEMEFIDWNNENQRREYGSEIEWNDQKEEKMRKLAE